MNLLRSGSGLVGFGRVGGFAQEFAKQYFLSASVSFDGMADELQGVSADEGAQRPAPQLHHQKNRRRDEAGGYTYHVQCDAHLVLVADHPVSQPVFDHLRPEFLWILWIVCGES